MRAATPIRFEAMHVWQTLLAILAMGAVVLTSNVLVQYPINN